MKTRRFQKIFCALSVLLLLFLSACQVNFMTDISKDGSGTYIQEIGFQGDEASMGGLSSGGEDFCANQNDTLPPGTTTRQETRNEDETWCVYETPFDSLEDLSAIYGLTDTKINKLSLNDGTLTYDLSLDLSGDSGAPMGADIYWKVTLPGNITDNNADEVDGNTLTWKLRGGEFNNIQASSEIGGMNFDFGDDDTLFYVFGGLIGVVFCCMVPLIILAVVFFLIRRNKKKQMNQAASITSNEGAATNE